MNTLKERYLSCGRSHEAFALFYVLCQLFGKPGRFFHVLSGYGGQHLADAFLYGREGPYL